MSPVERLHPLLRLMSSRNKPNHGQPQPTRWYALLLFLALLKLVLYVFDANPQVFLGDSMSYLVTAMNGWIPPDRSFVYGYIIHAVVTRSRSLSSLVAVQTVAGIATSLITAGILVRYFRTSFTIAATAAIAVALEPQQLLFERFVLTESLSTMVFAGFLFLAFEYLRHRQIWALAALQGAGLILLAFRVSFVPMLAAATIIAPLIAAWPATHTKNKRIVGMGIHLLVSIGLFAGLHWTYKQWNGSLSKLPPAYTYADGFFLITNVSPLVIPSDTDNATVAAVLANPLVYAEDPGPLNSRNAEMFAEGGLVERLRNAINDDYQANLEAKRIAYRAILRDPIGFARLAICTYLKFYSKGYMAEILYAEAGARELAPNELKILAHFHLDANGLPLRKTLIREYFQGVWPYYILLANTPLVLAGCLILARHGAGKASVFLFVIGAVHITVMQVLGVEPSPRHLHTASVLLAVGIGAAASRLLDYRRASMDKA